MHTEKRVSRRAPLIAHPADRLNVLRALAAPVAVFYPFVLGFPPGGLVLHAVLLALLFGKTNYILHLHVHRPFSRQKWLNRVLDLALGLSTGMTSANWRIQHVYGHHLGRDDGFRSDASWQLERYSLRGMLSFTLGSLWGTFWAPVAESWRKGVVARVTSPIDYRSAFVEQALLIVLVVALLRVWPGLTLTYLLPWYAGVYFISRYVDYLNHYGCTGSDVYACANNSLSASFNRTTHNFGYHSAHHQRPGAHWTELPRIHAEISQRIPAERMKTVSWSFLLAPYHVYLAARGRM